MRKKTIYFSFLAVAIFLIFCSHKNGPGTQGYDCTGAETLNNQGNPTGCGMGNSCHSIGANASIGVSLELDSAGIPVTSYVGGKIYDIKIKGVNNGNTAQPKFGFQICCIKGTSQIFAPNNAGTFSAPPAKTHVAPPFSPYTALNFFEHDTPISPTSGSGGNGTTYIESATWTAPAEGTGVISFWGALNAVDGDDNADNGDIWNNTQMNINEEAAGGNTADIATVSTNDLIKVYPNPVNDNFNLQWKNAETGTYIVSIYNLKGQNIALQNVDVNGSADSQKINTASWLPGIYIVSVQKGETRQVFRIVKR